MQTAEHKPAAVHLSSWWPNNVVLASAQWVKGLAMLLGIVLAEFIWFYIARDIRGNFALLLPAALLNATLTWIKLGLPALLLYLAAAAFSRRVATWLLTILTMLLIVVQILLTVYFAKAAVPLGADLYGYSWQEICQTIGAAGGLSWIGLLAGTTGIAMAGWWLHRMASRQRWPGPWPAVLVLPGGLALLITSCPGVNPGDTEFTRNLLLDKTGFFLGETWRYWHPPVMETDIYSDAYIPADESGELRQYHYVPQQDYPFLTTDTIADVLSPFFRHDDRPPHLVIILVEGLGRAFANDGAYLGDFTPFLDSLSQQSLYWDNFLSAGGRTFAALPSILGSLPYARQGFLELGASAPPYLSLQQLLRPAGYQSEFYYGGDASFDNMAAFLRHDSVDIYDGSRFPSNYIRIPSSNGFSWGYNDASLFRFWLDNRRNAPASPQLSILLTLSTHSPFLLNDPAAGRARFERRLTELGLDESARAERRLYADEYASILYTDSALRDLFAAYARHADFAHTVFLITGDHRMPEIPMRDKIDRFHVPLIIYSPLLRRRAIFHSVSTHLDITPSLLAWLHASYALPIPTANAWVGDGLDTAYGFRNVHQYALIQTKTDLVDFVSKEDHLNNGNLFRLHSDLSEEPVVNDTTRSALESAMEAYRLRNGRWLGSRRLWPDSVLQRFSVSGIRSRGSR